MAAKQVAQSAGKTVFKPLLSTSHAEARRRVLNLYRAWWREVPHSIEAYQLEISTKTGRAKVREEFMKNAHVRDIRVIDMLVIKGKMELEETHKLWKQATHVMRYFKETQEPRKTEFMERFFDGYD
ncbi:NADH dehydrogenase [ubiquinone] 1 alpha subcomplex subunit 6 [Pocillopora verrucosa]|uniref:NADH dehydrogenase [ubiquinone] 1 alpha subcomplex subunit 6 n=1 Tax=Pocillopora meandrina TaxID=46732 RepID=A0AAU9VZP6_9CNID|nr:NADH dehydrogenase [ubiquinone] 1 alpha subcomplex subunit 6-like [Pocillopora damicornis]XP_058968268.1 NADH dehydrogenase [ubiquinone] 1 alpha subcomplex subunit 6-like [Pocillopora verrucosa]CAH3038599.1 unnamed protein product [Pocillopora meandrina]